MIEYDPKNWLQIALRLRGSVAPRLMPRVLVATGLGALAQWAHHEHGLKVPPLAHTLIGVALGLLLVFRTNASYGRYVEARELLGRIVNSSRDLARQVSTYILDHPERRAAQKDILRWIGLFYRLLAQNVRDEDKLDALVDRLPEGERARLVNARARAPVVATWISKRLGGLAVAGAIDTSKLRAMDGNIGTLVHALGGCERIRRTPVPFAYAQHIKVFVVLFCYTVPFALADALLEYTWVAAGVLAFALFGIDEIGVEIEDPFGYDPNDLPLERIGETIDSSLHEIEAAAESAHPRGGPMAT